VDASRFSPIVVTGAASIGIIGAGPRGLSVLARLHAGASTAPDRPITVHLVDPFLASGSAVWRTDQASELLMNTVAAQITMFADETVDCVGPIVPGPSLHDWARYLDHFDTAGTIPEGMRGECRELGPDSYPSRALYGHYLRWVLGHLLRTRPQALTIALHAQTAVELTDDDIDGKQLIVLEDGTRLADLDSVVLTQGHVPAMTSDGEAELADFADRNGHIYVAPGNPADVDLDILTPGRPVALRGMGLNFFDHMALLTIGRGGRFGRGINGGLTYYPSGREPVLVTGSRRGVPYHSRGENQKGAFGRHEPIFLTPTVIALLRKRQAAGRPADFRTEVWPLIDREVRAVYYATQIKERWCGCDAELFLRRYSAAGIDPETDDFDDPFSLTDTDDDTLLFERFGIGDVPRWSWTAIARPYGDRQFADDAAYQAWLLDYLREDVREGRLGNVHSPMKAALDAMRDLRNEIRLIVDHGGLSGDSYRDDLQAWYTPFNAFVSIGPPTARIEQLIALVEAGIVRIVGPGMTVEPAPDGSGFLVGSRAIPGEPIRVGALIEARLPEPDIRATTDPLIGGMLARGECVLHRIPNASGGHYQTGGLAVDRRPYNLLTAARTPHPRRFAFGIPTETVHWVTAAGIRPGVNSVILADADAVAHASVAAAEIGTPEHRLSEAMGL
jgi:hypothetical protein